MKNDQNLLFEGAGGRFLAERGIINNRIGLSYGMKMYTEGSLVLSQSTRLRDRISTVKTTPAIQDHGKI